MNRREWLARVIGVAAAAAVAPLIDLTDATPAFWNQAPLKELMPWHITFPDGMTCTFDATVLSEKLLEDGSVNLVVRPIGKMEMALPGVPIHAVSNDYAILKDEDEIDVAPIWYADVDDLEPNPLASAIGTTVRCEGRAVMELQSIEVPALERADVDATNHEQDDVLLPMLQHRSLTFNVRFSEKVKRFE